MICMWARERNRTKPVTGYKTHRAVDHGGTVGRWAEPRNEDGQEEDKPAAGDGDDVPSLAAEADDGRESERKKNEEPRPEDEPVKAVGVLHRVTGRNSVCGLGNGRDTCVQAGTK